MINESSLYSFLCEVSFERSLKEALYECSFERSLSESLLDIIQRNEEGPNETSKWIQHQGPELLVSLRSYLTKKMPKSAVLGKIDDHISKFLEDIIRRDAIGKRKRKGIQTHLSQVKAWCVRNSHTQNRDAGTDAHLRCMHGALTKKEWESDDYSPESWTTTSSPSDVFVMENLPSENFDFVEVEDSVRDKMDLISEVLSEKISSEDLPIHLKVLLSYFLDDQKVSEIAKEFGMETKKISSMINRMKKILRSEKDLFF